MQDLINRINFLAKKAKAEGLSPEEKQEQSELRARYVAAFRANAQATLDSVYIMDENGKKTKLKKRSH